MLVYLVTWQHSTALSKGKGRATSSEFMVIFTVLCRTSEDALNCLRHHFRTRYKTTHGFTIDDGVITLQKKILDSRSFTVDYLYMDNIREPLSLDDLSQSLKLYR